MQSCFFSYSIAFFNINLMSETQRLFQVVTFITAKNVPSKSTKNCWLRSISIKSCGILVAHYMVEGIDTIHNHNDEIKFLCDNEIRRMSIEFSVKKNFSLKENEKKYAKLYNNKLQFEIIN